MGGKYYIVSSRSGMGNELDVLQEGHHEVL